MGSLATALTQDELQLVLEARGLDSVGDKAALIERIIVHSAGTPFLLAHRAAVLHNQSWTVSMVARSASSAIF